MRTLSDVTEDEKRLCNLLKHYRVQAGLSAKSVASSCGLNSPKTVYLWESGRVEMTVKRLLFLCDLYGVPFSTFFGVDTDDPYYTSDEIQLIAYYRMQNEVGKKLSQSCMRIFAGVDSVVDEDTQEQ